MSIERLAPLVGTWRIEVPAFGPPVDARLTIEPALGGAFALQRSTVPIDVVPDALCVIAANDDGTYTQHYFDSRGVVRVYAMTFDGREWTLSRTAPDFTPLSFQQRYVGTLDGDVVSGRWERRPDDGAPWELDFELTYTRMA